MSSNFFMVLLIQHDMEMQFRHSVKSDRARLLSRPKLIIWEQMSMANKAAVECDDVLMRLLED